MEKVRIFDTTLRDGEQTPGVSLTPEQKLEIALQLNKLGVDVIEVGFPMTSQGECKAVKMVADAGLKAEVCALARTLKEDVDVAMNCSPNSIHTFISTSDIHMKYILKMKPAEVLRCTEETVNYIKDHGLICEFSPMDATRTKLPFLKKVCKVAEEAGADRINIPDTVGVMTPGTMERLIADIVKSVKIPISVHCHNDMGIAVANTLVSINAGARQAHVTVNGLGERAGNAALEEVVMGLHLLYGKKTNVNTRLIYSTSQLVRRLTGVLIQPNKAIVGDNAFAHESGIHTHGVVYHPLTFEPIKPETVGRVRKIIAGKHAGRHGIKAELRGAGFRLTDAQLDEITRRAKELGDKGKMVTDADLFAIARSVTERGAGERRVVELVDLAVVTGISAIPTASVKLRIHGKEYVSAETGVGPVDATIRAIQKITEDLGRIRLSEYRLEALTGGSNAVAEVVVKVEDDKGNTVSSRSAREDIVMASVEAMINAINKLLIKKAGS